MARADFGKGFPLGTRLGLDRSTEWARARSDAHSNRHWNSDPQRGPAVSNRRRDTVVLRRRRNTCRKLLSKTKHTHEDASSCVAGALQA